MAASRFVVALAVDADAAGSTRGVVGALDARALEAIRLVGRAKGGQAAKVWRAGAYVCTVSGRT